MSEGFGVHEVVGGGGQRGDADHHIGGGQQPLKLADMPDFVDQIGLDPRVDVNADYAHAQPFEPLRDLNANRADGNYAGGLAVELEHSRRRLP